MLKDGKYSEEIDMSTLASEVLSPATKESSLFILMEILQQEAKALLSKDIEHKDNILSTLSQYKIKKITSEGRIAYLITFKNDTDTPLYSKAGYQITERHLTIDKFYLEDTSQLKRGLSYAHYTEIYKNVETQHEIIAHVYYD